MFSGLGFFLQCRYRMSAAQQPMVSDITDLREIAAAIRAFATRSDAGGEINQKLEAVAAEMELAAKWSTAPVGGDAGARARKMCYLGLKARQVRWLAWSGDTSLSA